MEFSTPIVFLEANKVALIKRNILTPPNQEVLPWSPMPRLDEKAIELKERQEEAKKKLEAERAEAAKRLYGQSSSGSSSMFGGFRAETGSVFGTAASTRKPNLSGAFRKLEEAQPQTSGVGLPGTEVPPGFSNLNDSEMPPGFDTIERKAEAKEQQGSSGLFGHIEVSSRRRHRNEEREEGNHSSSEHHRRASHSQEISLNFLKTQVFGN